MLRRVWAALLAVWATLAIVAVLAWSHHPVASVTQATPVTIRVAGKNGTTHLARVFLLAPGSAAHAGTSSSPSAGSSAVPVAAQGGNVFVASSSTPAHATTTVS